MLPQFPLFKRLELTDREDIEAITCKFPPYSDFNFTSLWCWDTQGKVRISMLYGNLVVRFTDYRTGEPFYSFLGSNRLHETVEELLDLSNQQCLNQALRLITDIQQISIDNGQILSAEEDRDNFDYVYEIKELHQASGIKYETQRNLIHRFENKYSDIQIKISSLDSVRNVVLDLSKKWQMKKENATNIIELINEEKSVSRIFNIENKNLLAICIYCKNQCVAYAIDEILVGDYAICHFAKADVHFSGVYSFLMKQNCRLLLNFNKIYLNFEQDLGLLNLRASKNAFKPKIFLKKYTITYVQFHYLWNLRNSLTNRVSHLVQIYQP